MHCELLLVLGASQERAGSGDAKTTFAAAAATARALGDAGLLGRAALGYAGRWSQLGRVEEDVAALLQDALAALGDAEVPLRARLLARLALELYYAGDPERRLALSDEAVALARRLDDPADARRLPRRAPLRALAARDGARAARGGVRAAADRRDGRRPRARAGGRGLDRGRPARARRHRRRRHPDRGRLAARRGAPPAALRVVDVAVPLRAGADRRALRRGRAARRGDARDRPPRPGRERHRTSTRSRSSTSAASRAGSPRSRRACAG